MAVLRSVAKTDTFEVQRQKINQIAQDVFSIGSGGSDLATGNLKLGDGTRTDPSLAFTSDSTLGIYKPSAKTFGFVSGGKKIADYSETAVYTFKDLIVQQNILTYEGLSVTNVGSNYDPGSYEEIRLLGGTGSNSTADIIVTEFSGIINNTGSNYNEGSYENVSLTGGSSSGAIVSFDVEGIGGFIFNAGSGYAPGEYINVPLTGGNGTGATADITIEGETTLNGNITSSGSGYSEGIYSSIQLLNKPTQTFVVTTTSNPGTPPPDNVYVIDGETQKELTLIKGNTYRFDLSDSSNVGRPLFFQTSANNSLDSQNYVTITKGVEGQAGAFVDIVIKPSSATETIKYSCQVEPGAGANISVVAGTIGRYGSGGNATITVNSLGAISNLEFTSSGIDYKDTNILQIYNGDVGLSGSGFEFTLSTPTYEGEITQVSIQNNGQNYVIDNTLSANSSDLGGVGSGFAYRIITNPGIIKNLEFTSRSSDYEVADILSLPDNITNIQTNLKGQVLNISTTLSNSSPNITVSSTTGILPGMNVTADVVNSIGTIAIGTTVLSVDGLTQITLSQTPTTSGSAILNFSSSGSLNEITVSSANNIVVGSLVTKTSGTGVLAANTTVTEINEQTNIITLSTQPTTAGTATLTFTPPFGAPTNKFEYEILQLGSIESFNIISGGNGYSLSDVLTVDNKDLTQPIVIPVINKNLQTITFVSNISTTVFSVGDTIELVGGGLLSPSATIYDIKSTGGFIESMLVDSSNFVGGDTITGLSISTSDYEIDTASEIKYRYFIDAGSGYELTPNLSLYVGNTYNFDLSDSSNSSHRFALSEFKDGIWGPSLIENVTTTLSNLSNQIIVNNSTGILSGMEVSVTDGQGLLQLSTKVLSVDVLTNSIILNKIPSSSGEVTLTFRGTEYINSVIRTQNTLSIKVIETTPNLYYYCSIQNSAHSDEGGDNNEEAIITINQNNPKVFGSNFSILVNEVNTEDVISGNIETGEFTAVSFTGEEATFVDVEVTGALTAPSIIGDTITATSISTSGELGLTATEVNVTGNFNIGSNIQVISATGDITTTGILRTNGTLSINNILTIANSTITSATGNDIQLSPATGRVAKVNTTTAIVIPSGNSSQRPSGSIAQDGAIRFNTDTNQYEGYSATTTSWSSLGGVRDLDGNTYIAAEAFTGANDNTLYFFNDANNTLKLTTSYLDFNTTKKIRSLDTSLPTYSNWSANTPVTLGSYVKYRNNLYEVTQAGTTGTSGNEPVHTTGTQPNGTAELTWYISAVAPLSFEEISELQVGPLGNLPLVINSDLRLATNVISTDVSDLVIRPNSGKRVTIDAATSLVIPAGDSNSRGVSAQGSIRYNTTITQYEGYNGTNWTSLGGVKDVDGNTYIIPETAPGANENILYFYNDGENTLQLSKTALNFQTISTISATSNSLAINAELVTFDNLAASIDNSGTSTFISSTQENLDLGLSVGLNNDHLLRMNTFGDIIINRGFGTGIDNNLTVLTNELTDFELEDTKLSSSDVNLIKGTTNTGSSVVYSPTLASGSKIVVSAYNNTTNDVEMVEFNVTDKGTDIYHTEYGNLVTGGNLIDVTFDFDASNDVRINFALNSSVQEDDEVNITVVKTIIKK
jgi:hypothetical protein